MKLPNQNPSTPVWKTRPVRWLAWATVPAIAAISFIVIGQTTPPAFPKVALSTEPLYAAATSDKPTLALALSVEYPTVGAQYVWDSTTTTGNNTRDDAYTNAKEYLGYYDAEACYTYNNAPTETAIAPLTTTDYKRFDRSGPAIALSTPDVTKPFKTSRMCANAFSGNFLNWASNSAIDMLRLALSGGDRYIDNPTLTVLQRAVLPNGDPICMWNSSNFPAKQLQKDGGGTGRFWGAVPTKMITEAGANDIWVANTLNRIYFRAGNGPAGGCGNTGGYTLSATQAAGVTVTANRYMTAATGLATFGGTHCADENKNCAFSGLQEILFGAPDTGGRPGGWITYTATGGAACTNTVTGPNIDPAPGTGKKCYRRPYTGTPPSSNALNSDGFFYSRVSVCEKDSTTGNLLDSRDYKLCTRYPNGNYKPTGVIQKYSEQMRLSAFGYLLDQDRNRYGGVLRAPMKYVGAKTFDISGEENPTANTKAEWNANNGVFVTNPENDTMGISGVVNYLNKFGRTGTPGMYKKHDPVSDLYYETLRYLQGLPPSDAATTGITTAMKDGFPVYTDWTDATGVGDPYGGGRSNTSSYSCQKNNIVVIGDVNTHDNAGSFPTTNIANNIPNIDYWTGIVGSFERGNATAYTDGQGSPRTTSNPNAANGSPRSDKIVGLSYWSHTQDIRGTAWTATGAAAKQRPGLRAKTFIFDVNEYGDQNTVNTRRYNNQLFTAAKYGGFESDPSNLGARPYNTFGHPFINQRDGTNNNDVWQKKDDAGEASTYYLQSSARGVLAAFDDIFSRASASARSIAGGAIQSKNLRETTLNAIYQGTFDTSNWSGDLLSIPVSVSAANVVTIGSTNNWTAATKLNDMTTPATSRNIVMGQAGATAAPTAKNFLWADMDPAVRTHLDKASPTATADGLGQDRVAYLRGDKTREGTTFRARTSLLGDIINSGVVYSGKPSTSISSSSYAAFTSTINGMNSGAGRTPAVFVGANDGMLHAFEATAGKTTSGRELFGYIPSWMGPKLSALTSPTYVNNHQSYVDGPPAVAEAQVGTSPDVWKTVLVSGTGAGGRGVFALDVTDPAAFSASKVMWEFTQADDKAMGYVIGRPQILKLRTSASNVAPVYRWFAVVGSGVNNYIDDGLGNYSDGSPTLFFLALDKAAGAAWTNTGANPNYYKITLPLDATLAATAGPGLVNFSAALGVAGEVAQMYMGDLHGKLWKLDFELAVNGTSDWDVDRISPFLKGTPAKAYPLYIARDASTPPKIQPITMAPSLIRGESQSSTYVAFGTGKYLEVADKTTTTKQSIYAVFDNESTTPDNSNTARTSVITGRTQLKAGTTNTTTGTVTVPAFKWGRPLITADLTATTERSGWYFDLPVSGERQISNAKSVGDYLVFGSLIPGAAGSAGTCTASGGGGAEYTINIDTGNGTFKLSSVGIMGEPLVMELEGATTYTKADNTGRRKKTVVNQTIQQGSTGLGATTTVSTTYVAGRLNWRQINNYQDRKAATTP